MSHDQAGSSPWRPNPGTRRAAGVVVRTTAAVLLTGVLLAACTQSELPTEIATSLADRERGEVMAIGTGWTMLSEVGQSAPLEEWDGGLATALGSRVGGGFVLLDTAGNITEVHPDGTATLAAIADWTNDGISS